jgi:hypothetical protein
MSTQQELLNSILVLFPDNTTGEITPADLRAFQTDFVNSVAEDWTFNVPANQHVNVLGSNVALGFGAAASTPDVEIFRDQAGAIGIDDFSVGSLGADFKVYNAGDLELGLFGWQNTPNVLTIGTALLSGGIARSFQFIYGGTNVMDYGVTTAGTWTIPKPIILPASLSAMEAANLHYLVVSSVAGYASGTSLMNQTGTCSGLFASDPSNASNAVFAGYGNHNIGPEIAFSKTRAADLNPTVTLQPGDVIGGFYGYGANGSTYIEVQGIQLQVDVNNVLGTGVPSALVFFTAGSSTGSTSKFVIDSRGNVAHLGAIATNATAGFFHIPTMPGTPTGTPTVAYAAAPMVIDTVGSKIWVRIGSTWKSAALT